MEQVTHGLVVWSGWLGGLGIGALMLLCYWVTGKPLGASRAYCAMLSPISKLRFFLNAKADFNPTRLWFLAGIPLGSFIAVMTSPGVEWTFTTSMGSYYDAMLPAEPWLKTLTLFSGGVMLAIGSRMAGGCTSGNVIVGVSHLSLPSIAAGGLFFSGGLLTVQFLYRFAA